MRIRLLLAIALLLTFAAVVTAGRFSAGYQLPREVVAGGGGPTTATNYGAPFNIVGQAAVESSGSANFRLQIGFTPMSAATRPVSSAEHWTQY